MNNSNTGDRIRTRGPICSASLRAGQILSALLPLFLCAPGVSRSEPAAAAGRWGEAVESALARAGTNRHELVQALEQAPATQREGIQFLVANMPEPDLQTLPAEFLLENLLFAYRALEEAPWAARIPPELFLDNVLPYASLTEQRERWRKRLYEICQPLVNFLFDLIL